MLTFNQQPAENLDYDFDFTDWLSARGDAALSQLVTLEAGAMLGTAMLQGSVVKVYVSAGTDGAKLKLACTLTTTGGRIKQEKCFIKFKEA